MSNIAKLDKMKSVDVKLNKGFANMIKHNLDNAMKKEIETTQVKHRQLQVKKANWVDKR